MTLTDQQVEAFNTQGILYGIRVADPVQADDYRARFDALEAVEGREKCQIGLLDRHFDQPFIWELATHPKVLDCIEALIGPDVMVLGTHFFCKYGQGKKFVAWHQDVTYWGLEPPMAVTAWYAIDDSDRENGCMQVIPGTHATGIHEHGKSQQEGNLLSINQEVDVSPEEALKAMDLVLKAGEISLHHGMLIHGSRPNLSSRRRCGLTIRYIPASVRQTTLNSYRGKYRAILVRGEDRTGHFGNIQAPVFA